MRNHRDTWDLKLSDDQEFVAANYFPITTGAYLKDDKVQLNIATDRAQGLGSLEDGQMEVMVHRRLLMDDEKGVNEHLNETETLYNPTTKTSTTAGLIVRGSLFLNVDNAGDDGIRSLRSKMEQQFFTPLAVFRKSVADEVDAKLPWLTLNEFPENVGLTTLVELGKESLLVRLTHLYALDEHSSLSKTVDFDFAKYFVVAGSSLSEVTELTLSGTMPVAESRRANNLKWRVEGEDDDDVPVRFPIPVKGTSVQLQAMEVRAFRISFTKSEKQSASASKSEGKAIEMMEDAWVKQLDAAIALAPTQVEQVIALE